jgi:hypothetical protein
MSRHHRAAHPYTRGAKQWAPLGPLLGRDGAVGDLVRYLPPEDRGNLALVSRAARTEVRRAYDGERRTNASELAAYMRRWTATGGGFRPWARLRELSINPQDLADEPAVVRTLRALYGDHERPADLSVNVRLRATAADPGPAFWAALFAGPHHVGVRGRISADALRFIEDALTRRPDQVRSLELWESPRDGAANRHREFAAFLTAVAAAGVRFRKLMVHGRSFGERWPAENAAPETTAVLELPYRPANAAEEARLWHWARRASEVMVTVATDAPPDVYPGTAPDARLDRWPPSRVRTLYCVAAHRDGGWGRWAARCARHAGVDRVHLIRENASANHTETASDALDELRQAPALAALSVEMGLDFMHDWRRVWARFVCAAWARLHGADTPWLALRPEFQYSAAPVDRAVLERELVDAADAAGLSAAARASLRSAWVDRRIDVRLPAA